MLYITFAQIYIRYSDNIFLKDLIFDLIKNKEYKIKQTLYSLFVKKLNTLLYLT